MAEGGFIAAQALETPGLEDVIRIGSDGMFTPDFVTAAGAGAEGMFLSSPNFSAFQEGYAAFLEKHKAKYGESPVSAFHAHAYDATNILFNAIEKVAVKNADGSLFIPKKALRDAIFATKDFPGLTGVLSCSPTGDCGARSSPSTRSRRVRPAASGRRRRRSGRPSSDRQTLNLLTEPGGPPGSVRILVPRKLTEPDERPAGCEHAADRAVHGNRDPDVPVGVPDHRRPGRCRRLDPDARPGRYSIETWIDLAITGAALGSVYALIALGYTMVYGILRMINFAHGEIFMAGAFAGYFTAVALASTGILTAARWVAGVGGDHVRGRCVLTAIALLVERVAYRPLRNAPRLVPLISRDRRVLLPPVHRSAGCSARVSTPTPDPLPRGKAPIPLLAIQWVECS